MKTISLNKFLKCYSTLVLLFFLHISHAKRDEVTDTAKVTATFESFSNTKLTVADFKNLLAKNPLVKVKDQKGNIYQVISFEVMWKRKDISDDEKTGKPKTVFYTVGATLNGNQFSKEWINEFTNYIKAGEQLFFDTILYFDPNKKANYKAPGFVITIQ